MDLSHKVDLINVNYVDRQKQFITRVGLCTGISFMFKNITR